MLTMAPAKLPNIIPIINKDTVCGTFTDTIIISSNTPTAPRTAAVTCPHPAITNQGSDEAPNVSKATPRLAPEVTPSTSGPASGLRNNVCISTPATDSAAPVRMAVRALGRR